MHDARALDEQAAVQATSGVCSQPISHCSSCWRPQRCTQRRFISVEHCVVHEEMALARVMAVHVRTGLRSQRKRQRDVIIALQPVTQVVAPRSWHDMLHATPNTKPAK